MPLEAEQLNSEDASLVQTQSPGSSALPREVQSATNDPSSPSSITTASNTTPRSARSRSSDTTTSDSTTSTSNDESPVSSDSSLSGLEEAQLPQRWQHALHTQTIKRHLLVLKLVSGLHDKNFWRQAVQVIHTHIVSKGHKVTTERTLLASLIGATRRAELYNIDRVFPKPTEALWERLRRLDWEIQTTVNLEQPAISPDNLRLVLSSLGSPAAKLYLTLMWLTAHRATSLTQLRRRDVRLLSPAEAPTPTRSHMLSLRFREGKSNRFIGIYTIHLDLPSQLVPFCSQQLTSPHDLFFGPPAAVRLISRQVSRALAPFGGVRAVRKGALQLLARNNIAPEDLLLLSRHTSLKTLSLYLGGGMHLFHDAQRTSTMSTMLAEMIGDVRRTH